MTAPIEYPAIDHILTVNNIEVIYNHVVLVLKGVSLVVPRGGIVALHVRDTLTLQGTIDVGGRTLTDGDLSQGWYVAPTIGSADRDYSLWRDEKFIPLVLVGEIDSLDEGIGLANASAYGLTAGFYGAPGEIDGFLDRIEAGVTYVNRPQGATTGAWPGYQPFGGWKGSGSTGKAIGSYWYLPLYLREQSRTIVD